MLCLDSTTTYTCLVSGSLCCMLVSEQCAHYAYCMLTSSQVTELARKCGCCLERLQDRAPGGADMWLSPLVGVAHPSPSSSSVLPLSLIFGLLDCLVRSTSKAESSTWTAPMPGHQRPDTITCLKYRWWGTRTWAKVSCICGSQITLTRSRTSAHLGVDFKIGTVELGRRAAVRPASCRSGIARCRSASELCWCPGAHMASSWCTLSLKGEHSLM